MVTCQSANQLKTPARFPESSKGSSVGSLDYTIMGKTADLTVVQKTIIDTLHKEGKTQTFITKEAVHRVLYPSMLTESWVEEKDAQPTERTAVLWGSSKIDSRIWVNFTRNELRLGSRHQEHHTQTCRGIWLQMSEASYLAKKKNWTVAQWSKVLFSDESKFCISFGNQGPRVWRKGGEAHSPSCLKSSVKFPQSVMMGCNVICWCWSIVFFENQRHCTRLPRNWSTSCFVLLTSFSWKTRDQKCRWAEGHCQINLGFTTSAVPQTDHLHATPLSSN